MTGRIAVEATISGRVQGVRYRGWTQDNAQRLGLTGWVRNQPDGTVRALFIGPEATVKEMLAACRSGPPAAAVTGIETRPLATVPDITDFSIRR